MGLDITNLDRSVLVKSVVLILSGCYLAWYKLFKTLPHYTVDFAYVISIKGPT